MNNGTSTTGDEFSNLIESSDLRAISPRLPIIVALLSAAEHAASDVVEFLVEKYSGDLSPVKTSWNDSARMPPRAGAPAITHQLNMDSLLIALFSLGLTSAETYYVNMAGRVIGDSSSCLRASPNIESDPQIVAIKHIDTQVQSIKYSTLTLNKILIVDDDRRLVKMVSRTLENSLEACIESADSVKTAYFHLLESLPDVCIVDIMLPDETGGKLIEKARECNYLRNTKFVFLSSLFTDNGLTPTDLNLGSSICVPKSVAAIKALPGIVRQVHSFGQLANPVLH